MTQHYIRVQMELGDSCSAVKFEEFGEFFPEGYNSCNVVNIRDQREIQGGFIPTTNIFLAEISQCISWN